MNSFIKNKIKLLPFFLGRKQRTAKSGIFRGLRMKLDLRCQTQLYLGLFEREVYKWVKRLCAGINTAVDIGAGEGEYTLYFLAKTGAKKVFAFEPLAECRARLMSNLRLNNLADEHRLKLSSKYVGSSNNESMCTLDLLLPSISPPCFIKIDAEYNEVDILKGSPKLLDLPQINWLIETHSKQLERQCVEIFSRLGYSTVIVHHAWWRLFIPEMRKSSHNRWMVAVRNAGIEMNLF
ncbi:MAG: FkbM family methyltransferase [Candidatus Omnitrophota bacterium]|nr:MAG: FkbM family methyltransferase [Candidatus Omnitrophota bacterium]